MAPSLDATSFRARKAGLSSRSTAKSVKAKPKPPQDVEWEISESSESSSSSEESTSTSSSSSSSSSERSRQPTAMRQPRVVAAQAPSSLMRESPSGEARGETYRHKKRTYRREDDEPLRRKIYLPRPASQEMEESTSRSFSSRQYSPAASYNRHRETSEAHRSHDPSRRGSTDQRHRRRHHSSREGSNKGHSDRASDSKRPLASASSYVGGKTTRPALQRSNTASYRRSSWFPTISDRRVSSTSLAPRGPLKRNNTDSRVMPAVSKPLAREGSVAGSERRSVSGSILGGLFGKPPPRGPVKRFGV
jgi:hypothetical protein